MVASWRHHHIWEVLHQIAEMVAYLVEVLYVGAEWSAQSQTIKLLLNTMEYFKWEKIGSRKWILSAASPILSRPSNTLSSISPSHVLIPLVFLSLLFKCHSLPSPLLLSLDLSLTSLKLSFSVPLHSEPLPLLLLSSPPLLLSLIQPNLLSLICSCSSNNLFLAAVRLISLRLHRLTNQSLFGSALDSIFGELCEVYILLFSLFLRCLSL